GVEESLADIGRRSNASATSDRRPSRRAGIRVARRAENARSNGASLHRQFGCASGNVRRWLHHGQTTGRAYFRSRAAVAGEFGEVTGEILASSQSAPARGQTPVTRYEHTQIGHVIVWSLLAIILIAGGGSIGSSAHPEPPVIVSIILLVCLSFCSTNSGLLSMKRLCAHHLD